MNKQYSHIIWDWNGTLFDDTNWCIEVMNHLLTSRGLKNIGSIEEYHEKFCFPIIDYYTSLGFDFERDSFETLASEFIDMYHSNNTGQSKLHNNALSVLNEIDRMGITQIILSASQMDNLYSQVNKFDIEPYFDAILGISNIYAKSKIQVGQDYINKSNVSKGLLIGDTIHDYEVAQALNMDCILVANGHQSEISLKSTSVPVVKDVKSVLEYIV